MKTSLFKIYKVLFLLGVFFIPFNSFYGPSWLGEFSREAAAIFFITGFVLLGVGAIFKYRVTLPLKNKIFQVLLLFIAWCFVATLLNFNTVYGNYFKETSGINRFIRQYFALLVSTAAFVVFYWNVIRKMTTDEILLSIRKMFLYSLIVASAYGFIEVLILVFGIKGLIPVLNLFDYFPFVGVKIYGERISSITFEAPALAIYLITIAGWMFSYILTEKGFKRFIPAFLVLVLTFFSGSRTGLVVIFVQLAAFLFILFLDSKFRKYALVFVSSGVVLIILLLAVNSKGVIASVEKKIESLNFKENLFESTSNKSRFGIQYASWQVFKENPITGVGYGQQTYHNRFHYPNWAVKDNYEFRLFYTNPHFKPFPPAYNLYMRIMTETGLIGIAIFMFMVYLLFYNTKELIRKSSGNRRVLAIVLFISFLGISINFLQIDTFRLYGFWICLVILIKVSSTAVLPTSEEEKKTIKS